MRSTGVVVVDDDHLGGSSSANCAAPVLDALGRTADIAPAEAVVSPSVEGADMAALGIDVGEVDGLAEPVGADTVRVMVATAWHSEAVEPPAVEAEELAHDTINLIAYSDLFI